METQATSAAPSPAPPTSPGDHGGPPGTPGEWTRLEKVLVGVVVAVVVVGVGLAGAGVASIARSTNHPRDTTPAEATIGQVVVDATRELPVDLGRVRGELVRRLAGWLPRHAHVLSSDDGREVFAVVLVRVDNDRGFLDVNGGQDACITGWARAGGEADVGRAWTNDYCSKSPPTAWGNPGRNVGNQRDRDSRDALKAALEAYAGSHEAPYDRVALREALGALSLPVEGAFARLAVSPLGDVGVALRATYWCVFGWLGASGGVQVWMDSASQCDPALAFERVPLRSS